jgi:phage terminase small subunit
MPTRATRKGATAARRAPKKTPAKARASTPQVTAPPDPALPLANAQHERFAVEYAKDSNGTQAYMRAYGIPKRESAEASAARLLGIVRVRARAEFLTGEVLARLRMESEQVLSAVSRVAKCDIRKAFDARGAMLPVHLLPDEVAFAIAGLEVVETTVERVEKDADGEPTIVSVPIYTKKLRFNDRIAALSQLGKHFKLFTEKVELAGPNGGPVPVQSQESPEQRAALEAVRKRLAALEHRGKDGK